MSDPTFTAPTGCALLKNVHTRRAHASAGSGVPVLPHVVGRFHVALTAYSKA